MAGRCSVVVLVSGHGSNLQALIDAQAAGRLEGAVTAVVSNRPDAYALERAARHGIPTEVVLAEDYPDRAAFDAELAKRIDQYRPDLLVLAGFMRILTPEFVQHYAGRMLNIHPSLLPKYRGLHTHRRALEAGDTEHGASVHFVTEELDGGPVVVQVMVPIGPDDNENTLAGRVQACEHKVYPLVVNWFAEGRLRLTDGVVTLDGERLNEPVRM